MGTHVALLRGINVGGKNRLAMAELVRVFGACGATDVRTYIQSGNVVFSAGAREAARIGAAVCGRIEKHLGLKMPVVVRTSGELSRVIAGNPFIKAGVDAQRLHVVFLADVPTRGRAATLDADRSAGDRFEVRGRDIYLHLPNGAARTKLTNAYFDSRLGTISTMRNWRTVLTLAEMAAEGD